ncbi:MAG: DNA helicase-2/ATP-dependent DNA helicase PcrA [Janthinobacterium sp.]|jgi:DNA helicase-2/ATP-dependent DNA helicase PcrA
MTLNNLNNPVNTPRFTPRGLVPTREQTRIQLAQDKVVLIEANAGAAKTTTLALRIGEALARKLAPESILALAFTPEARDVMRTRLRDIGIPDTLAARVVIMTFEDYAEQVLAQVEGSAALARCIDERDLKPYALAAIDNAGAHYGDQYAFLDLQTHNLALSRFLDVQLALKATMALDPDIDDPDHEDAAAALSVPLSDYLTMLEYEQIRLGSHEDVLFRGPFDATYDLARSLAQSGARLPPFRLVLCDELHDLNEAAFRILNALLAAPECYFVGAGDKDQVIHSQLGASEQYLQRRFASSYPKLARYPLTLTYRHGPHLAHAMAQFKQKKVASNLPLHTSIRQSHYDVTPQACAARVVEAVQAWQRDKLPLDGCAILLRERHQSVAIENALMHAGIGYHMPGMAGYLQREEILFLRGMLAIAQDNLGSVKSSAVRRAIVESLAIFGEIDLTAQQLDQAKNTVARDPDTLRFFFSGQLARSRSSGAGQRIVKAVAYLESVAPETPAAVVLEAICAQMDLQALARRIHVHPIEAAIVSRSIAGLIAIATGSGRNLRDFSEWLSTAEAFSQKKGKHLVLLDGVANAKGKEFDHVILPFLEIGEFPHPLGRSGEEENLFYVAATRARSRLTLISPLASGQRSAFIAQMKLASIMAQSDATLALNRERAGADTGAGTGTGTGTGTRNASGTGTGVSTRHELKVPYAEKNQAKALGAEWDATRKVWHVALGVDLKPFERWLRN